MFPCEISKNTFFRRTPLVTAFVSLKFILTLVAKNLKMFLKVLKGVIILDVLFAWLNPLTNKQNF